MKKSIFILLALNLVSLLSFAQKGQFGLHTELGGSVGLDRHNYSTLQLHVSPGIRINPSWFVGMGVGLNYQLVGLQTTVFMTPYPNVSGLLSGKESCLNFFSIPVYAHATYTLPTQGAWAPYVNLKLGYGIIDYNYAMSVDGERTQLQELGGLYLSPALGVKYRLNAKHALSLSVSYDMQNYKVVGVPIYRISGLRDYMIDQRSTGSLAFRLGWEF